MNIASLVQGLSVIVWIVSVSLLVFVVVRLWKAAPLKRGWTMVISAFVLALILTTVSAGLVFINPEERGVVVSALSPDGYRKEVLTPGLHFVVPFAENVIRYPISKQTYTMSIAGVEGERMGDDSISARTFDGQEVLIDASVIYAVDPTKVIDVHIGWQDRYSDGLVRAESRGIIRDVISQYRVEEVISTRRAEMSQKMADILRTKFETNGILLVDYVLRNVAFSAEYAASVEQKQIAQQQAQQAEYTIEQKKAEAQQAIEISKGQAQAAIEIANGQAQARIIEAQAEAEALNLIAEALKDNPDLLTYQYITKLAPNVSVMYLPSGTPFLFQLPQNGLTGTTTSPQ